MANTTTQSTGRACPTTPPTTLRPRFTTLNAMHTRLRPGEDNLTTQAAANRTVARFEVAYHLPGDLPTHDPWPRSPPLTTQTERNRRICLSRADIDHVAFAISP